MKEKIREILWNFVAGEVTDSEATQQLMDLIAVEEQSEQLLAFAKWLDEETIDGLLAQPEYYVKRYLSQ